MARKNTNARHRNTANSGEQLRQRQELRRSNAAGTHGDRRLKRQGTRSSQRRAALAEY